ncbi:MAG: DNA repair protein RecO [Clostridia bacterium]|nr:DNA repair protein RecO [Clostridia bacterium]
MEQISIRGLVVRETPVGEYDKLLTVITEEMGRIVISGKAVRSLKSKHMAATQLFCYSNFILRKSRGYYYISDSALTESFFGLRTDLDRLSLASYLCDVAAEMAVEGIGDEELLRLTLNTLYALANHKHIPLAQVKAAFELRSAAIEGFLPNLTACDVCGADPESVPKLSLDVMNGRLLCGDCLRNVRHTDDLVDEGTAHIYLRLTPAVLKAMRYTVESPVGKFLSFTLAESDMPIFSKVCEKYLLNHIEHGFYTLDFYKSLL